MFIPPINKKKFVVSLVIAFIAVIGDKNLENAKDPLAAAICDNLSHALIGAFTWLGTVKGPYNNLVVVFEFVICAILSSAIDADHFITARSLHLKDATNLKNRPFLHCTTLAIFIVASVVSLSHLLKVDWVCKLGWILAAALFSHHIRDSKRRGFWLWPFGSTMPTPYVVYILVQMFLPHILTMIMSAFSPSEIEKNFYSSPIESV